MKLSRIDLIAQNGGDGAHYKYEEVSKKIVDTLYDMVDCQYPDIKKAVTKILMEAFPNEL